MQAGNEIIKAHTDWIRSGKIGCVFASALVKQADKIGWKFSVHNLNDMANSNFFEANPIDKDTFIVSLIFPDGDINTVRNQRTITNRKRWNMEEGRYLLMPFAG